MLHDYTTQHYVGNYLRNVRIHMKMVRKKMKMCLRYSKTVMKAGYEQLCHLKEQNI